MLLALGRQAVRTTLAKSVGTVTLNSVRNSGGVWTYRRVHPLDSKTCIWQYTLVWAGCWYWIFYHCLTEPEHIYGHWHPIDERKLTDAELGIPGIEEENPDSSDMRTRKERNRSIPNWWTDLYHEYYGGSRILPRRAAYGQGWGSAVSVAEAEDEDEDC